MAALMEKMSVRSLRESDAETAAELQRELERELGYQVEASPLEFRDRWRYSELEQSSWAFEEGGRVVALGWLTAHGEVAQVVGLVARAACGRGLGTTLCELGEARARELGLKTVHQHAFEADVGARALFEARSYSVVRRFYEMAVELDGPSPPPTWPTGIAPRVFEPDDARPFYEAILESFSEEWGFVALPFEEWKKLRVDESDTSLYFVAWHGGEVAGFIRCEIRTPGKGFVGMLGVRRRWRQRGVGRALLLHALGAFHERGVRWVSLGVDSENPTGATRLYESVGMTVQAAGVAYEKRLA